MAEHDDEDVDLSALSRELGETRPPNLKTLRRAPKLHRIPFEKVRIPPAQDDPEFTRRYVNFVTGRDLALVTRLPLVNIQLGFRRVGEQSLVVDDVSAEELVLGQTLIRAGARPVLYVYRSTDVSNQYVCSDDAMHFSAYAAEDIRTVPCVVLGEMPEVLPHAALQVRTIGDPGDSLVIVESLLPPTEPKLFRIVGSDIEGAAIDTRTALVSIRRTLLLIHRKLQRFHIRDVPAPHYH
jgi:hypothetical protein